LAALSGVISADWLKDYLAKRVALLTGGQQTPDIRVPFDTPLFAAAH
jgi:hypothetical protein